MTRVGIVNDIRLVAEALRRIVLATEGFSVAWIAYGGEEAVRMARTDPADVVLMDLVMPDVDGVEATRRIMREAPCAILVVTATVTGNMAMVFEALGHGALDAVQTPGFRRDTPAGEDDGTGEFRRKLRSVARLVAASAARRRPAAGPIPAPPPRPVAAPSVRLPVPVPAAAPAAPRSTAPPTTRPPTEPAAAGLPPLVLIAASTGGPQAVADVLAGIGPDLPAAVIVLQHLDDRFAGSFVTWLGQRSPLPVAVAAIGSRPLPGVVHVAVGEHHLRIDRIGAYIYGAGDGGSVIRPSADVLFESIAERPGARGCAVVLTGMGRDGARGILALRKRGFHTIAQDAATSVIHGMPSAAIAGGGVAEVLPLPAIGPRIGSMMRGGRKG